MIVVGVLEAVGSSRGTTQRVEGAPPAADAAGAGSTGEVTGRSRRCSGLGPVNGDSALTGGTVVALRGITSYQPINPSSEALIPMRLSAGYLASRMASTEANIERGIH